MLVVLSLIALVSVISFPFLKTTLQSTAVNAAAGQVSNSLSAARVFATRNQSFVAARRIGSTLRTAQDNGDGYSGTIVLFAPDNSLRVMENYQAAWASGPAEMATSAGWLELQVPPMNGYVPVPDLEDIRFPGRVQMLGIVRTGDGPYDIQLVPPPFAIRFNADGTIGQGEDDTIRPMSIRTTPDWDRVVYVSTDGQPPAPATVAEDIADVVIQVDEDRDAFGTTLDLGDYGRQGELRMPDGRVQLPFGTIETVSGVLVLEPERVPANFTHPGTAASQPLDYARDRLEIYSVDQSAALLNWASENTTYARILLYNRYTGQDLTR